MEAQEFKSCSKETVSQDSANDVGAVCYYSLPYLTLINAKMKGYTKKKLV
jgi:hypothetical protein